MFVSCTILPDHLLEAAGDWYVSNTRGGLLMVDGAIPHQAEPPVAVGKVHVLGLSDGAPVRCALAEELDFGDGGAGNGDLPTYTELRALFGGIPDEQWAMAGRAAQVLLWERDHRFCGRCGLETTTHANERAKTCTSCGSMAFPRLSPAVIMLIERSEPNGPEVLLAWGRQFPGRFFSALAGFVEPGENLEECVAREVMEEVGVEVTNINYFGSQPWPFPQSLMLGFNATWVSGDIVIQPEEIVEANWYGPNDLPPVPRGGMSIAGWLMDDWLHRIS